MTRSPTIPCATRSGSACWGRAMSTSPSRRPRAPTRRRGSSSTTTISRTRTSARRSVAARCSAGARHLQDRKVPVHEVGFQAHLYAEKPIDRRGVTALCRELGRLGVGVRVTELDVIDWKLPADAATRDRMVAQAATEFLGAVIEGQRPSSIVTWGLSDRSSWVHDTSGGRIPPAPGPCRSTRTTAPSR